jgi:hypothetical protein
MAKLWRSLLGRDSGELSRYSINQYAADLSFAYQGSRYPIGLGSQAWSKSEDIENSFTGYIQSVYKQDGPVFAVILARMLLFCEARFCWFEIGEDGEDGRPAGREGLGVLEHPWPNAGTGELLARMEQDVSLGGNFYAVREATRLRRLRPDWLTIVLTAPPAEAVESDVAGYWYHPGRSFTNVIEAAPGDRLYMPEDICHWSPIPDPDAQYRGVDNAYRPFFLGSPVDTHTATADMRQLDFKITQGAGETRLCAAGGVPPIIVGLSEGLSSATYSNYGMARRKFGDHWGIPQWKSASQALQGVTDGPPRDDLRLGVNVKGIAFMREDAKDAAAIAQIQAATLVSLLQGGIEFESAKQAVVSGDLSLTKWTGMVSVQLQPPGATTPDAAGQPGAPGPALDEATPVADAAARALGHDTTPGHDELHHYWTRGEGLAKWSGSPTPWTTLEHHLEKFVGPERAKRMAAEWFHEVFGFWPGSDMNRVTHGKPPRGHLVGPG